MLTFPFRFAVALFRKDGSYLGTVPAERDWEPVLEWTRFNFQRLGELPSTTAREARPSFLFGSARWENPTAGATG